MTTFSKLITDNFGESCSYSSGRGGRWFYVGNLMMDSEKSTEICNFLRNHPDVTTYDLQRETSTATLMIFTGTKNSCIINHMGGLFMVNVSQKFSEQELVDQYKKVGTVTKYVK